MNILPAAITLVVSVVAGGYIAESFRSPAPSAETNDQNERDAFARSLAKERALARFERWERSAPAADPEADAQLVKVLEEKNGVVSEFEAALGQTESAVRLAEDVAANPDNQGERDVRYVSTRFLRDPVRMARAYLQSNDDKVRERGLDKLRTTVNKGDVEAYKLLAAHFDDPSPDVQKKARSLVASAARRNGSTKAVREGMNETGLSDLLAAAYTAAKEGAAKKTLLRSLSGIGHPSAEPGWLTIYSNLENNDRNRTEAARELRKLGRTGPYDELVSTNAQLLRSGESRDFRNALRNLGRLGGDEVKLLLQAELASNPDGKDARRIRQTVRRLERPPRIGGGRGNGGGRPFGG